MAQDALALDVIVQPRLQARPRPGERLVCQLDGIIVARHQAGADEQLDELFVLVVGGDGAPGDAAAHRLALRRGRHQPQQQVAQQWPLLGGDLCVDLLRRLATAPRIPPLSR